MTYIKFSAFLTATSLATIAFATPASAQETMQEEPAPEEATSGSAVQEILVTARRREEALQDVPISVSAISGEQLEQTGIRNVTDLQFRTPSLAVTSSQSQRNTVAFALRGQRVQEVQLFTDPPVGTYFAEVVQPRAYGFGKSFYDIGSVQVLKGVQGTLFGRNMTGGAVLVEPRHPDLGEFNGYVAGKYGNFDLMEASAALNIPIGDIAAIRIAGVTHERDGWAKEITSGYDYDNENYDTFRISGLIEPNDSIQSLTIIDYFRAREHGTASFVTAISEPSVITAYEAYRNFGLIDANIPAQFAAQMDRFRRDGFVLDTGAGDGIYPNLDVQGRPYENVKNWGVTNKTTIELSDSLTLKNIFGYRKLSRDIVQDYDGMPVFLITPYQYARTRNISEELQLQGKAFNDSLDFIIGGYYFEEKGIDGSMASTLPERNMVSAGMDARTTDARMFFTANPGEGYSRTYAGFVAGTFRMTDQLSLSGGLRYNVDKRKITVSPSMPNMPDGGGGTGVCLFDTDANTPGTQTVPMDQCSFNNSKTFKEWTYDATLQYEPSDSVTLYAAYRRGFRAGGFSTRATSYVSLAPFLPEFIDEYEVGLKTDTPVGTGRLKTSSAIFRQDGSNIQKQRATFVNGNVFTIVDNVAKSRNQGVEFEATLGFDEFTLTGFYSYVDVDILAGAATSSMGPEIAQRGTPKHQAGLTGIMSPPVDPSIGKLDISLNWSWRSANYLDDFEKDIGRQPAYSLVNARVSLDQIGETGFYAAAFVNNALNEVYRIGMLGLIAEGLGFSASVYGEPRTYGLEVGYRF
ncbi:MAG: TonB-dependent receptor [Sphingomonadaceae bacterium]